MRVKVFGGLFQGRVLDLPENVREGDYLTLPEDLPAGEMFGRGRSHPAQHSNERTYRLMESAEPGAQPGQKYLSCVANPPRFIRSVTVPPVPATGITINL